MNIAEEYANEVKSGRIVAGKYIKLAVDRYFSDLEKQKNEDWGYVFNEALATEYLNFFGTLRHGKGKWRGKPFTLMPWAAFIIWNAYGWTIKGSLARRFMEVYIKVARKNAKTELMAGVGLCGFYLDSRIYGEKDPEIYWYATKKDQAKIGWDRQHEMTKMLRVDSKAFSRYCNTATYSIFTKEGSGKVAYLGKDSDTEDGPSPHYGIADEKHAMKNSGMDDVIRSGMGARENPMIWGITTAGYNDNGPCVQLEKTCKQVLEGVIENDLILPMIFDLDKGDDWEDESVWIKPNPSIPYVDTIMPYLRKEYINAKTKGATAEINFKTKNLNVWTSTFSTWIPADKWDEAGTDFEKDDLAGIKCWAGLDLASTRDLCSFCLYFPPIPLEENTGNIFKYYGKSNSITRLLLNWHSEQMKKPIKKREKEYPAFAIWWHWLPEDEAKHREKNDSIPYTQWAKDGWIKLTPGNVRDDRVIIQDIKTIAEAFSIQSIAYDRWGAANIVITLTESGAKMEAFGQGFASMSAPTKAIEQLIFSNKLNHGNNPVMRWQASNVAIQMDPAENIKIAKNKSTEKVDGMVALAMAIGESMDKKTKWGKIEIYSV